MPTEAKVDTPTAAYNRMARLREPIEALYSDTEGMRAAGHKWLPQEIRETADHYQRRLARSFLIPLYADGVDKVVAKPFCKPVQINGDLPPQLADLQQDVDGQGTDITTFTRALFQDGVDFGELHAVVDAMAVPEGLNRGEERELGVRPYFCRLEPPAVIAARPYTERGKLPYLSQLRAKECYVEPDGDFGERDVKSVRVWTTDGQGSTSVTVWTATKEGEYQAQGTVPITYGGGIPHAYASFDPVGPYESEPCMAALAWLNVMHWQSYSDHRNWLKMARTLKFWGHGLPAPDAKQGLTIAENAGNFFTSDKAHLFVLEPQGSAMAVSFKDLEDIEQKAQLLAMMPYVQQATPQTATAKSIDEERGISVVQSWVRLTERSIERLYQIAAEWYGVELPEDFSVDIFSDFGLSLRAMQDAQTLLALRAANQITQEDLLREMKGRGVLGDMLDIKATIDATRGEREKRDLQMAGLAEQFKARPGEPDGPQAPDDEERKAA